MPTLTRKDALKEISQNGVHTNGTSHHFRAPTELFGENVFSMAVMRQVLPKPVYKQMVAIQEGGATLDPESADAIAAAMKDWALARGATHYSHWFHPLHGQSAEKHLAFMVPTADGSVITEFTGLNLLQGEPDASSFPSGGVRSTFEARGYTGWDPTSPAFLIEGRTGKTLCIPSVFLGFNSLSLDKKAPLLRSIDALSKRAVRVMHLFGNKDVKRVFTTVGCEQEYFLIDRKYFLMRPDLIAAGRTLFGARPPKGQEMEDHYFGTIKDRVLAYMEDMELELLKLGIPVTTRHNEVAPSQFEIAPMFERSNIATDHNQLMMSVMRRVAHKHGFECLLHEKPFAGINGSGKHNNWSMADDKGNNLLEPGGTPQENAQFLVFLTSVIRAIHVYADLLRVSIATPGNDHRLGANEAPPAIMSVYLGDKLSEIVNALSEGQTAAAKPKAFINIGASALPPIPLHDSDRNRTSPFAFTGNKFEFRAVGSGQNIARPNTILNTIIAESLSFMADAIEHLQSSGLNFNDAVRKVVQEQLREHRAVLFSGDNYSKEWQKEAEARGLPNLRSTVEAIPIFISPKSEKLFKDMQVLTHEELHSRYHIKLETYVKTINIEAGLMSNMGRTMILPAAFEYQRKLASTIEETVDALEHAPVAEMKNLLQNFVTAVEDFISSLEKLDQLRVAAEGHTEDLLSHARYFRQILVPAMEEVRRCGDALELIVDDNLWPLPKYREMLFLS